MRVKYNNCIREVTKVYLSNNCKITFTDEKKFTDSVQIEDTFKAENILELLVKRGYYDFDFDDKYGADEYIY